jgi:alpha-beta hydrolase superfamily lysophospholipase
MGSFIALQCLTRFGDAYRAAVLSGSSGSAGARAWLFRGLATFERLRLGARGQSALLQRSVFGQFNVPFEPAQTPFDWLSRDSAEVAKYVADPLCGFVLTAGSLADLATALSTLYRREHLARIPRELPILAIAGERDPVGGRAGVDRLVAELRDAGLARVDERIYPDARHELLNETNRDAVTDDLRSWLRTALGFSD